MSDEFELFSESTKDVNSSSAGSHSDITNKPSRHVSIQIPVIENVVRPRLQHKNSPSLLSHTNSINSVLNSSSTATCSSQSKPAAAAGGRRITLPGKSTSLQLKNSKLTFSSMPSLEKKQRKPLAVCDKHSTGKSNSSSLNLADNTVLSRPSRKITTTTFSGSDINRTLASEVTNGRMSKDLARLVVNISKEESQTFPLPKRKAIELRNWMLAADSGCLRLPISVQNHLMYTIQVNNSECSTAKKSRNLEVISTDSNKNVKATSQFNSVSDDNNVTVDREKSKLKLKLPHVKGQQSQRDVRCSAVAKPLGKAGRSKLKYHPTSNRHRSLLTSKARRQESNNDNDDVCRCAARKKSVSSVTSCSSVAESAVESKNNNDFHAHMQPQIVRGKAAVDNTVSKRPLRGTSNLHNRPLPLPRNQAQSSDSDVCYHKRSVQRQSLISSYDASSSPSFDEAQNVISKINRTLQIRRMLRNSSLVNIKKSANQQYSTSNCGGMLDGKQDSANTGLKHNKLQHLPTSSTTERCSPAAKRGTLKLVGSQNYSAKSQLQKVTQQKAGTDFCSSIQDQSSLVTADSSKSSLSSRECRTVRQKAKFSKCSSDRSARMQDSETSGLSRVSNSSTASSVACRSPGTFSSKTQENLVCSKTCKGSKNITAVRSKPDNKSVSQNSKPTPAVISSNSSTEKVGTSSNENKQSFKSRLSQAVRGSKLSGRWSDIGSWDGKVYTVKPVTSRSKMQTPKSINVQQHMKSAQLPLKMAVSGSKDNARNEQLYQHASDKSSAETVISRVPSKSLLNTDVHMITSSFSSFDMPSPHFEVHTREDPSESKEVLLKRHVNKPSPVANKESPTYSISSEKEASKRQTRRIPISVCHRHQKMRMEATSESESLQSVVSETAKFAAEQEKCGMAEKRFYEPDTEQKQMSRLSDTESAISNSTFLAENLWHFGVPPQS